MSPQVLHRLRQKDCHLGDGLSEFKVNLNKLVESNIKVGCNSVTEHPSRYTKPWVQFPRKGHSVKVFWGFTVATRWHVLGPRDSPGKTAFVTTYLRISWIPAPSFLVTGNTQSAQLQLTLDEPWMSPGMAALILTFLGHYLDTREHCAGLRRPPRISAVHRMEPPCTRTTFSKCPCS